MKLNLITFYSCVVLLPSALTEINLMALGFFSRQTVDMLYFLLIMVVFLLAYGVAQQAILYPNEEGSWAVLSGVFFRPYFQVYGELFVEAPDTSETSFL